MDYLILGRAYLVIIIVFVIVFIIMFRKNLGDLKNKITKIIDQNTYLKILILTPIFILGLIIIVMFLLIHGIDRD